MRTSSPPYPALFNPVNAVGMTFTVLPALTSVTVATTSSPVLSSSVTSGMAGHHGIDVDRERCRLLPQLKTPMLEDLERPAIRLLARLEHQDDIVAWRHGHEQLGGAQEHRHVQVVTTSMHRAAQLGAVGKVCSFVERKGVYVRPQNANSSGARCAVHSNRDSIGRMDLR